MACVSNTKMHLAYMTWKFALWDRNYGPGHAIDAGVRDGKLVPGVMPDEFWRPGDSWMRYSDYLERERKKPLSERNPNEDRNRVSS